MAVERRIVVHADATLFRRFLLFFKLTKMRVNVRVNDIARVCKSARELEAKRKREFGQPLIQLKFE